MEHRRAQEERQQNEQQVQGEQPEQPLQQEQEHQNNQPLDQQPPPEFQQVEAIYGPPLPQVELEQQNQAEPELIPEGGPHMPAEEAKLHPEQLQQIDERQELEESSEQRFDDARSHQLNPLGLSMSFGPELQRFNQLELNSHSGFEDS